MKETGIERCIWCPAPGATRFLCPCDLFHWVCAFHNATVSPKDCCHPPGTRNLYDRRDEILADPGISFWLKAAIRVLDARDPVDAAKDADLLAALFDGKCKALLGA